ncbi:MAG: transketolase [Elusimicrobia bacterium]|nr:transketolase [Elusimicrobiota bacterium]
MDKISELKQLAKRIRISALKMVHHAKGSHLGGALSMADILAVLYGGVMRVDPANPEDPERDRFILSKGHTCSTLYAVLAEKGYFKKEALESYCVDGAPLPGHITKSELPGIELSTGSLGHGLPVACGMALALKRRGSRGRVFVILGDGECDEGSNWEAFLFAQQHALDNLVVIVDKNEIQSLGTTKEVMNLDPLDKKLETFNWGVKTVDGNDIPALVEAFSLLPISAGRPSAFVAKTVKGKGASFMENQLLWHYKTPTKDELARAIAEIEGAAR